MKPTLGLNSNTSTAPNLDPRISTDPEVGCICAEQIANKVDLPAPLGPKITQRSFSLTCQSKGPKIVFPSRRTETL